MSSDDNISGSETCSLEYSSDNFTSDCDENSGSSRNSNFSSASDVSLLSDCSVANKLAEITKTSSKRFMELSQSHDSLFSRFQNGLRSVSNHNFRIGGHLNCSPDETCQCYHCVILNTKDDAFNDHTDSLDALDVCWRNKDHTFYYDIQNRNLHSRSSTSESDSVTNPSNRYMYDSRECVLEIENRRTREFQIRFEHNLIRTSTKRNGIYESTRTSIVSFGKALICIWRCMRRKFSKNHGVKAVLISKANSCHIQIKDEATSSENEQPNPNNISDVNENTNQIVN